MIAQARVRLQQHRGWVGAAIGVAFLLLALRGADLRTVAHTLVSVHLAWLGLALSAHLVVFALTALRWQFLLRDGDAPPVWRLLGVLFVAQLMNAALPGRTGIAARAYLVGNDGPGIAFTLVSVILEKVVEGLTVLPIVVALLLLAPVFGTTQRTVILLGAISASGVAIAALVNHQRDRLVRWSLGLAAQRAILQPVQDGIDSLAVLADRSTFLRVLGCSFVIWGLTALSYGLALKALELRVPMLLSSLWLLVILQAGVRVPTAPGGIGVLHYLAVFTLGRFGVSQESALSYGILLHGMVFLVPGLLGALYLVTRRNS